MGERTKKPIRILVATGLYAPEIGGPATHVDFLERNLPEDNFVLEVVPFSSVRNYPRLVRHLFYLFKLLSLSKKTDIIYALDPVSVGLPAKLAAQLRRKSFLLRLGGDYAWEQAVVKYGIEELPHEFGVDKKKIPLYIKLLHKVQFVVAKAAKKIVVPSNYLGEVVKCWGIDENKIVTIYNPLEPDKSQNQKIDSAKKVILAAGRLNPIKCFQELIVSLSDFLKNNPNIELRVAGDGPLKNDLANLVMDLNLQKQVFLLGSLSKSQLKDEMLQADVFVQNSLHESFPNIVLEAMSVGLPVVATAVGGTVEIIEDGKNGLLLKEGDDIVEKINSLFKDEELHKSISDNGKKVPHKFLVEGVIGQFCELFREFVKIN